VIATLRNRNFSLLWLAGLVSQMGNWMLFVALPFHVYAVTGSALATSAWLMAYILPGWSRSVSYTHLTLPTIYSV